MLESGEKVPAKVEPLPVDETTPCFRNIHVKNLVCAGARRALFFNGIPEMPIENVVLEDVDITSRLGAEFVYSKAVTMKNVTIRNTEGEKIGPCPFPGSFCYLGSMPPKDGYPDRTDTFIYSFC